MSIAGFESMIRKEEQWREREREREREMRGFLTEEVSNFFFQINCLTIG